MCCPCAPADWRCCWRPHCVLCLGKQPLLASHPARVVPPCSGTARSREPPTVAGCVCRPPSWCAVLTHRLPLLPPCSCSTAMPWCCTFWKAGSHCWAGHCTACGLRWTPLLRRVRQGLRVQRSVGIAMCCFTFTIHAAAFRVVPGHRMASGLPYMPPETCPNLLHLRIRCAPKWRPAGCRSSWSCTLAPQPAIWKL